MALVVRIVMIVPVSKGCPGIAEGRIIVAAVVIIIAAVIRIIQVGPTVTVPDLHPQELVVIIPVIVITILTVVFFFCLHIFFFWPCRRIIHIIRSLTGFVGSSATA